MVNVSFPNTFDIGTWLESQMELYADYKKVNPDICRAVLKATVSYLELWHKKILADNFPKEDNTCFIEKTLVLDSTDFNRENEKDPCKDCPNLGKSDFCNCTLGNRTIIY